jgi:hypothetical protein
LKPFITPGGCIPVWDTNHLWSSNKPIGGSKPKPLKKPKKEKPFFLPRKNGRNLFSERVV